MNDTAEDPKIAELAAVNRTIDAQLARRNFLLDALGLTIDDSLRAAPLLIDERIAGMNEVIVPVLDERRMGREVYLQEDRSTGDNLLIQYQDETGRWVDLPD